jgi:hypothetical protein
LEIFARELGSIGLSCAPGTTGIYTGRPKPTPVVRLFTFFLDKKILGRPWIQIGSGPQTEVEVPSDGGYFPLRPNSISELEALPDETMVEMPLGQLAYARSGDKGNSANIAIIARKPKYMALLRRELTPNRILEHFSHLVVGPAERFEAPGLHALNFLMSDALGGGGMASRRIDPQGKAYGQMALEMIVSVPKSWAEELRVEKSNL